MAKRVKSKKSEKSETRVKAKRHKKVAEAVEQPAEMSAEQKLGASTIRPGLMVALSTSLRGNVQYLREDIEREHPTDDGKLKASWQTERTINDPDEHKRATKTRDRCRAMIRGACVETKFTMLCPQGKADNLYRAIADARKLAEEFNSTSVLSKIDVFVYVGKVEQNDVEAIKSIRWELTNLMKDMEAGLENLEPKRVREAAMRAKSIGRMLSEEASTKIENAVNLARKAATKIMAAAAAGDQVAQEVDRATINKIAEQRSAFLELSEVAEVAVPAAAGRAVEVEQQPLDPIEVPELGEDIREGMIEQMVTGLIAMPQMLEKLEAQNDDISVEVVKRYKERTAQVGAPRTRARRIETEAEAEA